MDNQKTLTTKNYIGYAFCDAGGMLAFSAMGSYLSVYFTDILKISTSAVFIIMLVARIWDGINDPIMGFFVQARKPSKHGKYRPYLIGGGIPLAVSVVLIFTYIPGLSSGAYIAIAAATYILYGMLYTVVCVPYGSLASVMTVRENERSLLSVFRSIGGGVGSIPTAILFPMLVLVDNKLDSGRLFTAMLIIAVLMIIMYFIGFSWTRENVPPEENPHKMRFSETLKSLLKNRAFVLMSIVGCLLMASSMYMGTVNVYLFKDYFGKGGLLTVLTIISYAPMVIMIPFVNKMIKNFGKKEISVVGLAISCAASFIVFVLRVTNPWIYILMNAFINLGVGFLTLEVWAMAMDVSDYQELKTKKREEAVNYAVFTFMRKVGQALAALAPFFVGLVGYDSELVGLGQNTETLKGMYTVSTLVPFIMFAVMLACMILYPLNKKKTVQMREELAKQREAY
ncbi:MAG: MFS transporter [Clostridiales bacterium]|nr:MFS transporter [Clostridiales bacterium]